jgi:hypothetical protein
MTDEERQRQMEFILDTLARLTATTERLAEMQARQDERWAHEDERWAREEERDAREHTRLTRLEQSFVMLIELAERHEEQLDQNDTRAQNFSAALNELRRLIGQDGQQS